MPSKPCSRESGNRSWGLFVAALGIAVGIGIGGLHSELRADEFQISDGRKITGTVLSEEDGIVELWTPQGPVTVRRDQIEKQRKTRTAYDRYLAKREKARATVKSQLALAKWCEKKELAPQARLHFEAVLELDPDHTVAHQSLGHRKVEGEWRVVARGAPGACAKEDPDADHGEDPEIPPFVLVKFAEGGALDENAKRRIVTELRTLLYEADRPMHFFTQSSGAHDYELSITLEVEKGKKSTFYGHGLQQRWTGRVDAILTWVGDETDGEGRKTDRPRIAVCIEDLEKAFTGKVELAESEAKAHTGREALTALFDELRDHPFLRKRGLKDSETARR